MSGKREWKTCACGKRMQARGDVCAKCRGYGSYRSVMSSGYIRIYRPRHPLAYKDGYVLEHRLVVFDAGVDVPVGSHIHHRNGDKADNRIENLAVVAAAEHALIHIQRDGMKGAPADNARKTHCKHGHAFTPENTYRWGNSRGCRTCAIARVAAWKRAQRAKAAA